MRNTESGIRDRKGEKSEEAHSISNVIANIFNALCTSDLFDIIQSTIIYMYVPCTMYAFMHMVGIQLHLIR